MVRKKFRYPEPFRRKLRVLYTDERTDEQTDRMTFSNSAV